MADTHTVLLPVRASWPWCGMVQGLEETWSAAKALDRESAEQAPLGAGLRARQPRRGHETRTHLSRVMHQ